MSLLHYTKLANGYVMLKRSLERIDVELHYFDLWLYDQTTKELTDSEVNSWEYQLQHFRPVTFTLNMGLKVSCSATKRTPDGTSASFTTKPVRMRFHMTVTCGNETSITVEKQSKDYDFGLRLELKQRELTVISESSYYRGRSDR